MNQPIKIEKIDVVGFRAYLQAQTVPLFRGSTPLSLAVFAPNAAGKSSLVDAFEFYFSEDSTLRRLGKRTFQSNAGPIAMEHVRADAEGLTPSVHLWFRQGNDKFDDSRLMSDGQPIAAKRVLSGTRLPFVIRGYELRGFVEETTPGDRYKELAAWFSLEPLSLIQKNLKALRSRVKQSLESNSEIKERSRDIARATADNITSWDDSALCSWLNVEVLAPLDSTISLRHISELDPGFQELTRRKDVELDSIGIGQLKRLSNRLEPLIAQSDGGTAGMILAFEAATQSLQEASDREEEERSKASNAIFNQVWDSAKKLFDGVAEFEACPICDTSFLSTPHGSRGEVHAGLSRKLSELAQYREAEKGVTSAKARLEKATSEVKTNLETAIPLLEESGYGVTEASDYLEHIQSWKPQEATPDSSQAIQVLANIQSSICEEITRIEQQQGESTFNKAFETVQELLKIKTALDRIQRTKKQLGRLHQELDRQTLQISSSIVDHVQKLVGQLQDEVRTIYEEIQGTGVDVPQIRIELPEEDDVDQQRAQLVIDYSDNRKDVVPSGYLSDSQIHTLVPFPVRFIDTGRLPLTLDSCLRGND